MLHIIWHRSQYPACTLPSVATIVHLCSALSAKSELLYPSEWTCKQGVGAAMLLGSYELLLGL